MFRCRSTTFFAILFHINPLTNSLEHLRDVNIQVEKCTQFFMGKRPCRFINCRHSCLSLASRGQISTYHFLRKNLSNALNTTPDVRLRHTISILTKNLLIPDFLTNFPTELNSVLHTYIVRNVIGENLEKSILISYHTKKSERVFVSGCIS